MKTGFSALIKKHDAKLVADYVTQPVKLAVLFIVVALIALVMCFFLLPSVQLIHVVLLLSGIILGNNIEKLVAKRVISILKNKEE